MPRVALEAYFDDDLIKEGIEIGALHSPYNNKNSKLKIRYVDRMTTEELRKQYPELNSYHLVTPDIVDDGEKLTTIPNNSLDFIIANHFLEHCENLLKTVEAHLQKLKLGGLLYYYVPNKDYTFDKKRKITTIDHILDEYYNGHLENRKSHFEDWCENVDGSTAVTALMEKNYSIHFHVWDEPRFLEITELMKKMFDISILFYSSENSEIGVIIRKNANPNSNTA